MKTNKNEWTQIENNCFSFVLIRVIRCFLFLLFFLFTMPLFAHDADIEIKGENRYKSVILSPPV